MSLSQPLLRRSPRSRRLLPPRPLPRRLLLTVRATVLGGLLILLSAAPASAHSALLSTDPVEGSVLSEAPSVVTLVFNEDVAPQFVDGAITLGTEAPVPVTATVTGGQVALDVAAETVTSGAGQAWQVDYRVVSADGHPISGTVAFTVEAVSSAAASTSAAVPAETPVGDSATTTPSGTASEAPTATSSTAPSATTSQTSTAPAPSGGSSSTLALATGLGAVAIAVAVGVVVMARRRRGPSSQR